MDPAPLGRLIMWMGALLLIVGGLLILVGRFGIFGNLPGDIVVRRDDFTLHFPLMTCIILSVVLTLVLNLLLRR